MKYLVTVTLVIFSVMSCSNNKPLKDMGIFDRFKKEKIEKTHQMMDEDQFWSIIEKTKKSSADLDQYTENITRELSKLSNTEIIGFHIRAQKLRYDSYTSDMWCAGYVMNGGCSDDCFEYFRCWVIAQGKEAFYAALKHPDWLVRLYSKDVELYDYEDFMYVATEAFEQKNKKDIEDYVDYDVFKEHEGKYPEIEFTWEEENEESMKKICPELMKVAWD